jgi:NTP pyrophosphatase (non-canonical NTP hydrolase)
VVKPGLFSIGSDTWPGISKLIEEAGEVQQVCGKLLGTGGATAHWDGSDLRQRLQEEIADVVAAVVFVAAANKLDEDAIEARIDEKVETFKRWHLEQGGKL